jgi:hypothetical protein
MKKLSLLATFALAIEQVALGSRPVRLEALPIGIALEEYSDLLNSDKTTALSGFGGMVQKHPVRSCLAQYRGCSLSGPKGP